MISLRPLPYRAVRLGYEWDNVASLEAPRRIYGPGTAWDLGPLNFTQLGNLFARLRKWQLELVTSAGSANFDGTNTGIGDSRNFPTLKKYRNGSQG